MISIDLNCDLGEGMLYDEQLMPLISSANIACGYHAGDTDTIKRTAELCLKYNVAIGAHPGFADKENFGRKELHLSSDRYYELVTEQLEIIHKIVGSLGATLHHVKPHGALYNMAAKDKALATVIAKAVKDFNASLVLYGLSGSYSITEAEVIGLKTASEVFADRTYQPDGKLTPRSSNNALINSEQQALHQVLQMITQQTVTAVNDLTVTIKADTVCIHGDGEHAVDFAKLIHHSLKQNDIVITSIK